MTTNINELERLRGCTRKAYSEVRHAHNNIITLEVKPSTNVIDGLKEAVSLLHELDDYFVGEIKVATRGMTVITNDLKSLCDDVLKCINAVSAVIATLPPPAECGRQNIIDAIDLLQDAEVLLECAAHRFVIEIKELEQ